MLKLPPYTPGMMILFQGHNGHICDFNICQDSYCVGCKGSPYGICTDWAAFRQGLWEEIGGNDVKEVYFDWGLNGQYDKKTDQLANYGDKVEFLDHVTNGIAVTITKIMDETYEQRHGFYPCGGIFHSILRFRQHVGKNSSGWYKRDVVLGLKIQMPMGARPWYNSQIPVLKTDIGDEMSKEEWEFYKVNGDMHSAESSE